MATVAIGKVEDIEGSVEVVHADGSKGTLEQGAIIYADDVITTAENSNIRIEFADGSRLNLDPEFTVTLNKAVFDPALIDEDDGSSEVVLDASGRAVVPDSGHDTSGIGEKIGTVETTEGLVEAVDGDGNVRVLEAGDALYTNDILRVASDGNVSIRLVDGSFLSFGPDTTARMDDSVPTLPGHTEAPALSDPAEIQAAILAGRDPSQEATAPGAGEPGSSEGGVPVILSPSGRAVTPDSGHDTHGFELPFTIPEPELLAPESEPDKASVVTAAASGPDNTVYESGLNPDGSNAGADSEKDTGTFTVSATDGIKEVVIGGTTFTLAQMQGFDGTQTVNTGEGVLTLDGYTGTAFSGTVSYTYELSATIDNDSKVPGGDDAVTLAHFDDSIEITVNGVGGTTASDDLVVRAIDDVPDALNDGPESVTEDGTSFVSGNVLTNDVSGADTAKVFDSWTATGKDNTAAINGLNTYGTLVQNATTGAWSYTLNNADADTQALTAADHPSFDLWYTMKDADGDASEAKLTITVNGADDGSTVVTAAASGPDNTVYESGLNPDGSNAGADSEKDTGTFTVSATDGIKEVVIGGTTFTLAQMQGFDGTQTVNTGEGVLTLDGYTGTAFSGTVSYTYELSATIDNDSKVPGGDDAVTLAHFDDSIEITVNGVGGTTASDDLVVRAIDDVPTAVLSGGAGIVQVDETSGVQGGDDDDTTDMAVTSLFSGLTGASSDLPTEQYATSSATLVDSSGSSYGADQENGTTKLSLAINGGDGTDSGLETTGGTQIFLYKSGNLVVGRIGNEIGDGTDTANASGEIAFAVAIDTDTGIVSTVQYASIKNPTPGVSHDETADLTGKIDAVVTVTDGDLDTATETTDIGDQIKFSDDGPTAFVAMPAIVVNSGDGSGGGLLNFLANTGADGLGDVVFSGTDGTLLTGSLGGIPVNLTALFGENIELNGFGTTTLTGTSVVTMTDVFTITLDPSGDTYTIDFNFPLDDGSGIFFDSFGGVNGGNLKWRAFDSDGNDIDVDNNDSEDLLITAIGNASINTNNTDIGAGNNHINKDQFIRLDMVIDVARDAPDNESDVGGYIYDGHYQVDNFRFKLFQTDSDNVVKLTVFNFNDGLSHTDLPGGSTALNIIDPNSVVVTDSGNNILILGTDYDVYMDASGNLYVDGIAQGDSIFFGTTGANTFEAVQIENADTDMIFDVLTSANVTLSGSPFSIGGFAVGTVSAGSEINFDVDLVGSDGDGDTTTGTLDITISPDGNTATAPDSSDYALMGDSSNDILVGNSGDDILIGGNGDDTMTGDAVGTGADTFVWQAGEFGTDTITDFDTADGDILNIADLLVGEESPNLDHSTNELLADDLDGAYISISIDANATITLFSDGGGSGTPGNDQVILTGYDTTGFANSAAVIESLLDGNNLVVD